MHFLAELHIAKLLIIPSFEINLQSLKLLREDEAGRALEAI
jgi:hypothetical protein